MRILPLIYLLIIVNACSFNKESTYWSEDNIKRVKKEKMLDEIIKKSDDITLMSYNEYETFLKDYTKKSKYPELSD